MTRLISIILFANLIVSCAILNPTTYFSNEPVTNDDQKELPLYEQKPLINNVNHYTKWLVQDLFSNIDYPNNSDVFAIANFSLLDSDLKTTNHFGRQLQESIMHETNRTGFTVIDLKSTGRLQLTTEGDIFWHSEKADELTGNLDINFIVTGTMTKHQGGYLLNARIINVDNNALISTSQILVPTLVVNAVLREQLEGDSKGFPIISSKI